MAIIKQVQIETNGVLNDIGAKYDEAENPIRGTYGASLDLPIETEATGGTSIQLVAKDNTVLSTVNLELDASFISDGILPVEFGGTGVASLTENSVLIAGDDTVDEVTPTAAGGAFYAPADSAQQDPSPQTPIFGTLPVEFGGTGITAATAVNSVLIANSTSVTGPMQTVQTNSGAFYSTGQNVAPIFGELPVGQGGTGKTSHTTHSVLIGNGTSNLNNVAATSAGGAFYAEDNSKDPEFGILPVLYGGTGTSSLGNNNNSILYLNKTNNRIASLTPNSNTIRYLTQENGELPTWSQLPNNIATTDALTSVYATNLTISNNNTLTLWDNSSPTKQSLNTVSISDASYNQHGLMSANDKIKLDGFELPIYYATVNYVNDSIAAANAMVFKGVVNQNSDLPSDPSNGWTYKVGTAGTYQGYSCQVGDLLMYSSGSSSWEHIEISLDGGLYKTNPFTDGGMLIASGTQGAVTTANIAPTVSLSGLDSSNGQTITISVGGQSGTSAQSATLGQATTSVYGVTKLTSTASKNSLDADSLAVTPAGVYNILRNDVVAPVTDTYTLLPSTSSETANNTDTFKWQYDSTNNYYYVTIQSPNITANSYEFVTTADSVNTSLAEIAALQAAAIVPGTQTRQDGAGYGTFLLIAKGTVPSIITHIRVTHNYSSAELNAAETTAWAGASAAELAAASAHNMIHRAITISSTVVDSLNFGYPYKYVVDWSGVKESDWIDGTGVTNQDWTIEASTNQIILHFSNPITSSTVVHLYWAPCNEYTVEEGEDI